MDSGNKQPISNFYQFLSYPVSESVSHNQVSGNSFRTFGGAIGADPAPPTAIPVAAIGAAIATKLRFAIPIPYIGKR